MPGLLQRYRVILVSPRTPGNIGATARLLANFDCPELFLVTPQCDWQSWDARKFATGIAASRFDEIRVHSTLASAVGDSEIAIGFTRRQGNRRRPSIDLRGITELPGNKVALVFGNEETGLSTDELNHCTHTCSLVVSEKMGSLNLSHAVAVVLSRIFEAQNEDKRPLRGRLKAISIQELDALMAHWADLMKDIGLVSAGNPERMSQTLRKLLSRAGVSSQEARALRGLLSKTQVKLGTRRRGKKVTSG